MWRAGANGTASGQRVRVGCARMNLTRRFLALPVALLALVAAGCGKKEEPTTSEPPKQPSTLAITATGEGATPTYKAPAEVEGGAVTISFTNNAKGEANAQLVKVEGEHPDQEVVAQLGAAMENKPVEDWFGAAGGVGETKPGQTASVTQVLEPGTYYILGGEKPPEGAPTKFEVTEGDAPLPEAEAKVIATDYAFSGLNLKPGKVTLSNEGKQWHHFLAAEMKPDATLADVKKFLQTEQEGPPPFVGSESALESTVMDGGVAQIVDADLKPGRYAFYCFVADQKGGPPHVAKGMISEVNVQG